ncbi:hypothetical protein SUGI_0507400 [Cryptomeria japonica]|nr:hypothetical protein SUGI_0507400 [Cryptomeria japonica]
MATVKPQFNPSVMATVKPLFLGLTILTLKLHSLSLVLAQDASFARPGQLSVSTSFSASPGIQLLRNDTLSYAVLSSPNGATQLGLLLHSYNGKQGCSAALQNATSYIIWMRPCPPLAYTNCTLTFTAAGELILATEGVVRWNSNTSSKGVGGIRVTDKSDLQILNKNNQSVWNSHSDATPSAWLAQFEPLPPFATPVAACAPAAAAEDSTKSSASSNFKMAARLALISLVWSGVLLWVML